MEALGRSISVIVCAIGMTFCILFFQSVSVHRQKTETARSMVRMYTAHVLEDKKIRREEWESFQKVLHRLGDYQAEITVYERRRFEDENGRLFLFYLWEGEEAEREFSKGSYVRITVTEEEPGRIGTFLFGDGAVIISGGRIA